MNLKEFPRVEYWAGTKWEPYKEDIQREIRKHFDKDAQDLKCCLQIEIDLGYGNEEWMYTAHFFPKKDVPTDRVDPLKQKMMEKATKDIPLHQALPHLDLRVPESRHKEKGPIDPPHRERQPHGRQ